MNLGDELISVIVPCYNCSTTIEETVKSIISNENVNLELILIDDGSTDGTSSVLQELKRKYIDYCDLKILYQSNQGVSAARNYGIEQSKGTYITFVDSDDVISDNHLVSLLHSFKRYDIDLAVSGMVSPVHHPINTNESLLDNMLLKYNLLRNIHVYGYCCNKMYKLEIINNNNIRFNTHYKVAEDLDFNLNYSQYVSQALFTARQTYHYLIENSGTMFQTVNPVKVSYLTYYHNLKKYKGMTTELSEILELDITGYAIGLLYDLYRNKIDDYDIEKTLLTFLEHRKYYFFKHGIRYFKKWMFNSILLLSPKLVRAIF